MKTALLKRRDAETQSEAMGNAHRAQPHPSRPSRPSAPLRLCVLLITLFMASAVYSADALGNRVPAPSGEAAQVSSLRLDRNPAPFSIAPRPAIPLTFLLAEAAPHLSQAEGAWLIQGLGVAAFLIFMAVGWKKLQGDKTAERTDLIKQVVSAVTAHFSEKHETTISGQPLTVTQGHPCVEQPTFEKHVDEIWRVVNGLRLAISRIETVCGENKVLREANADRLIEVAMKQDVMNDKLNQLIGKLEKGGK